jgi:hypothetical protein
MTSPSHTSPGLTAELQPRLVSLRRWAYLAALMWSGVFAFLGFVARPPIAKTYYWMLRPYDVAPWITTRFGLTVLGVPHSINPLPGAAAIISGALVVAPFVLAFAVCRTSSVQAFVARSIIASGLFASFLSLLLSVVAYGLWLPWAIECCVTRM